MDDSAGQTWGLFSKIFGKKKSGSVTEEEIMDILNGDNADDIDDSQKEMISNIFEFDDIEVKDVMTHRTDISAVEINSGLKDAVSLIIEKGFSRIPVYDGTIDNIFGVIYAKDLLRLIFDDNPSGHAVSEFIREIKYIPETNNCFELFDIFTSQKIQIAVAVDEYGGTAGIVTMEDLLEAIVGNIQDEYDNEAEEIQKISKNIFEILGTADTEDIAEELGITIPEENDFDTIGGFVINLIGRIPEPGERPSAEYGGVRFTVISVDDKRIKKLRAEKL